MTIRKKSQGEKDLILKNFGKHLNASRVRILKSAGLDIVEDRREGAYVWDVTGKKYIDCLTGAGSFNVGRRNPEIIKALKTALSRYDIGGFLFFSELKVELAKKLAEISPGGALPCVMYGCGGGEANDFAIKLARGYTLRTKIISAEKGYHGHTGFALSAIGRDAYQKPFQPLMPDFIRVKYGDVGAMEKTIDSHTAAVILEPVQGEGGINVPPSDYFPQVRRLCDERGALLIVDEIQTGWGRTGKIFGINHSGIIPDIMTVGKSLGGGIYPITAALYKEELQDFLFTNPFIHLSTFGGSDLGCAVALSVIKFVEENRLWEHAAKMGEIFKAGFAALLKKYPQILLECRQQGLMMGLKYANDSLGPRMSLELSRRGVLAVFTGNEPSVMRLMPSLVIQPKDVEMILNALDQSMNQIVNPDKRPDKQDEKGNGHG